MLERQNPAEQLLSELAPYRGGNLLLGSVYYFGAADLFGGMLENVLERHDQAAASFDAALTMHRQMRADLLTARTMTWAARAIRGAGGDVSRARDFERDAAAMWARQVDSTGQASSDWH